jgi:hypothetical protein
MEIELSKEKSYIERFARAFVCLRMRFARGPGKEGQIPQLQ